MKAISKKNALVLMSAGMFVIATAQIASRFVELPDLTKGLFVGIGIGLLLLSVTFGKLKSVQ